MRLRHRLVGVGVLLILTVGGAVRGAPIYDPTPAVAPAYELQPVSSDVPETSGDALWLAMTDAGALDLDGGGLWGVRDASTDGITDRSLYEAEVGLFPQITFAELGGSQTLTDQYVATSGVDFIDGDDQVIQSSVFPEDWWGVDGDGPPDAHITIQFVAPQMHMGVDHPGYLDIDLYDADGGLVWSGSFGEPGTGHFAGVVLAEEFVRAELRDPFDGSAFIDTLYYDKIPEPGTLVLLGFGALALVRWKR